MLATGARRIPFMTQNEPQRGVIGGQVMRFQRVTSTMDVAWQLVEAEAPHGMTVVAQTQTAGRGRFSRRWVSGEGDCLLTSVLLRPPVDAAAAAEHRGSTRSVGRRAGADRAGVRVQVAERRAAEW